MPSSEFEQDKYESFSNYNYSVNNKIKSEWQKTATYLYKEFKLQLPYYSQKGMYLKLDKDLKKIISEEYSIPGLEKLLHELRNEGHKLSNVFPKLSESLFTNKADFRQEIYFLLYMLIAYLLLLIYITPKFIYSALYDSTNNYNIVGGTLILVVILFIIKEIKISPIP